MTKTNSKLRLSLGLLAGATLFSSTLSGCNPGIEDDGEGIPPDSDSGEGGGPGAVPGTAGGGPVECEGSNAFQQAYVCAGSVYEARNVSQRSVRLYPIAGSYACHTSGTDLTPLPDDGSGNMPGGDGDIFIGDGDGDIFIGDGDGMGPIPSGVGGSLTGGWEMGGTSGDGDGDGDYYGDGDGDDYGDGDGDYYGDGDGDYGMGGAAGGSWGGGPVYEEGWCSEAPEGVAISGVTYSLNDCGDAEVKLPLVFQEPQNWYRLRVFHGETACERGEVVADTSGFGTGEIVELDVDGLEGGFITLEFTADVEDYYDYYWDYEDYYYYGPYYYGDALHLELEPIGPNLGGE